MQDRRTGMVVITALVLVLPIQLGLHRAAGSEPYPGLYQPPFGSVPERDGAVLVDRLTLTAATAGGPVGVDPVRLMPNRTRLAESIAAAFFADEPDVRAVAASGWLDGRLREQGIRATGLQVVRERVRIEPGSRRVLGRTLLAAFTVPISAAGP